MCECESVAVRSQRSASTMDRRSALPTPPQRAFYIYYYSNVLYRRPNNKSLSIREEPSRAHGVFLTSCAGCRALWVSISAASVFSSIATAGRVDRDRKSMELPLTVLRLWIPSYVVGTAEQLCREAAVKSAVQQGTRRQDGDAYGVVAEGID